VSGFIRRYQFNPGAEIIKQIEGVVIVDLPPPGSIQGVGTGTTCVVGEYENMQYAVTISDSGVVTTNPQPVEVFSSADMLTKVGGWDEFLGDFGADMGNAFVEIRNKRFSRLICAPVDLLTPSGGSQGTVRLWRQLPTNQSATVAQPITPVVAGQVSAGYEFLGGTDRIRLASTVTFGDAAAYTSGIDGAITAAGAAVTQTFNSATGDFVNEGVEAGDILVLGVIDGAGALGANADTYRVVSVTSATAIVVQKLDGASFNWTTGTAQPWRLHVANTADSAGTAQVQLSSTAGYNVLARPLDATIPVATALTPSPVPTAPSATVWEPLSGLDGVTHPSTAITYDANVHAPNVTTTSLVNARYQAAIDALVNDVYPARDINIVVSARKSSLIRTKLKSHVLQASALGLTRRAIISPNIDELDLVDVIGTASPGVGATRTDRIDYSWPGVQTFVPEAVGFEIATSDGSTTTDGILDVTGDTWLAAVESNLPPERNPGQATSPVPEVMAPVLSTARGTPNLGLAEYVTLKGAGICAVRFDRTAGPIFQSGVTSSLVSGEETILRRRMADFIQDSVARRVVFLSKQPLTRNLKDTITGEIVAFLDELLSPGNPSAQRIYGYEVDDVSGNTPAMEAQGIFVVIIAVRLTPTADFIVIQTNIGQGVVLSTTASTNGALAT